MAIKAFVDFQIDVKGDMTDQGFAGSFTAKTKLSMRDQFRQDEIYRANLGVNSQAASDNCKRISAAIAYLAVHLVKVPDWWDKVGRGVDLEDVNVLAEINNKCQEAIEEEYKKLQTDAEAAEKALTEAQKATA